MSDPAAAATPQPDPVSLASVPAAPAAAPARRGRKPLPASRWAGRALAALALLWIIAVSFGAQIGAWVGTALGSGTLALWVQATWAQAVLLLVPLLPLSLVWRVPRYRAMFRTWMWAAGYLVVMAPTRWLPPIEHQLLLLLQIAITTAYFAGIRRATRRTPSAAPPNRWFAIGIGLVLTLPWLTAGALGSVLDSLLALLLAAALGALAWAILHGVWLPARRVDGRGPRRDRFSGGLVAGGMLLILASGVSHNGVQALIMLALPAAAWAALASGAPGLVVALAAAVPLLLVDADVVNLVAADPLLAGYLAAAGRSILLGWGLGLVLGLPRVTFYRVAPRPLAVGLAVAAVAVVGLLYWRGGQPGFYGDRLFVVLTEQADLAAVDTAQDVGARRAAVYATLVDHASASQTDLRGALDRLRIGHTSYYLVNALEVEGGLPLRLWLALRPDVGEVLLSPVLRPLAQPLEPARGEAPPPSTPPWNLTTIGADRVWRDFGARGQGIVVGQSDSGVDAAHTALAGAYRGAASGSDYNWLDPWYDSPAPVDYGGHGTHTLGTVLGAQVGVAPDATWFACANLVRNLGNPAKYLDCMQFMLAPYPLGGDPLADGDPAQAADVLNNSWGCPHDYEGCSAEVFAPALAALRRAGIFVVASAGNSGPRCGSVSDPIAIYDSALTVGAIDRDGNLAGFSSAGPVTVDGSGRIKPDIVAPGVDVLSTYPAGAYETASGTSMAGPHVVGVVALMWSANPALIGAIDQTEALLLEAAQPFTGTLAPLLTAEDQADLAAVFGEDNALQAWLAPDPQACLFAHDAESPPTNTAGYGVVDAYRAVELALEAGR